MRRRGSLVAWCLFDFANSAFTTVVVTSVFAVYFVSGVVPAGGLPAGALARWVGSPTITGELLWSAGTAVSLLLSAILAPLAGAAADAAGAKRRGLIASALVCICATAGLGWVGPGQVAAALVLFIAANIAFEVGYVFYNGFLPELVPPQAIGRLSGTGWAIGYLGGLVSLAASLAVVSAAGSSPSGLSLGAQRACLLAAAHFLIFSLPAFFILKDAPRLVPAARVSPFVRLRETLGHLGRYREAVKFLLASLIYNDGATTIFIFAGIYMDRALHFSRTETIVVLLLLNLPSAAGSFACGFLADRIGGKNAITLTLIVLLVAVIGIALTAPAADASPEAVARAGTAFRALAMIAAAGIGANQSASRGLMANFIPAERHAEFFGFFIFSGKLASVFAPLTYGLIVQGTGSNVLAILSVAIFLLAGGAVLLTVDEPAGIRAAQAST